MNTSDIFQACKLIEQAIEEKGYTMPEVDYRINWFGDDHRVKIEYRAPGAYTSESMVWKCKDGEKVEHLFEAANAHVQNLTDPDEAQKADFLKQLGRVIDRGRELGIDDFDDGFQNHYIAQLEHVMKQLSKNIITDQSSDEPV